MKQIDVCLDRLFEGKPPLKAKWQSALDEGILRLWHYHHLVLIYNLDQRKVIYQWWERPADKRGLDAAKQYLSMR